MSKNKNIFRARKGDVIRKGRVPPLKTSHYEPEVFDTDDLVAEAFRVIAWFAMAVLVIILMLVFWPE